MKTPEYREPKTRRVKPLPYPAIPPITPRSWPAAPDPDDIYDGEIITVTEADVLEWKKRHGLVDAFGGTLVR